MKYQEVRDVIAVQLPHGAWEPRVAEQIEEVLKYVDWDRDDDGGITAFEGEHRVRPGRWIVWGPGYELRDFTTKEFLMNFRDAP